MNVSPADLSSARINPWWTRLALLMSLLGVAGSLYLSAGMDLKACPLCLYQRAFMMATACILLFGLCLRGVPSSALTPLALASTLAGGGIALFHSYLDYMGILECPIGVTGVLVAPQESLLVYAALLVLLLGDLCYQRHFVLAGLGAMVVGSLLAATCVHPRVTPPSPTPLAPYPSKLDGCRKTYHSQVLP